MAVKNQKPTTDTERTPKSVKKPSKAEQMAAFKTQTENTLTLVEGLGDLEIYVKPTTFGQYRSKIEQVEELRNRYGQFLMEERSLALELYDETGELYFDVNEESDMQFLKDMPFAARQKLSIAIGMVNGGFDIPKTLSTTKSD